MKQLACEMCGSTDMLKQDGYFVCQFCGCKYSVEEAKKMMIEGTVDVSGTVKIDNTSFVEKYLNNARRAYLKEDWEEVEKYYNMVEQNVSDNIEAVFFSAYGKAMLSMTDSEYFKREQKFDVLKKSISVISDYYATTSENKQEVLTKIANAIKKMNDVNFVYLVNQAFGVGSRNWQVGILKSTTDTFVKELKEIHTLYNDSYLLDLLAMFERKSSPATPKSNGIAALVMSIIGLYCSFMGLFAFGITSIAGIILGAISVGKANSAGKFKGLALACLIAGILCLIIGIVISPFIYDF